MAVHRHEIETHLDFCDIGQVPALVKGVVETSGLFGPGRGYRNVRLEEVKAVIKNVSIDVTTLLTKAARASLEEEIEAEFDRKRWGA